MTRPEWTGDNPCPGLLVYTEKWAGVFLSNAATALLYQVLAALDERL